MKTAAFTVRATEAQSIRWKRAADAEGLASVGNWLARAPELRGWVAPPFGLFRGNAAGPKAVGAHLYTLTYAPTGRLLATFRYAAQTSRAPGCVGTVPGLRPPSQDLAPIVARHRSEAKYPPEAAPFRAASIHYADIDADIMARSLLGCRFDKLPRVFQTLRWIACSGLIR